MSIKAVLFDLDGTLLPMDLEMFLKAYFGGLAKRLAPHGYDPDTLIKVVMEGTDAMIKNDGKKCNEDVFWDTFYSRYGDAARADYKHFEAFYEEDFDKVKTSCGYDPEAKDAVMRIKDMGLKIVLATTPVFPQIATEKRASWAGFSLSDFDLYTTYENSHSAKPSAAYYLEIADKLGVSPEECLMVGNDVSDDMAASNVGMKVFLLPKCLINKHCEDIEKYPHGDFSDLIAYIKTFI